MQANDVVTAAVKRVMDFNRRTLDAIAARLYFYLSLTHEYLGTLSDIRRLVLPILLSVNLCIFQDGPGTAH